MILDKILKKEIVVQEDEISKELLIKQLEAVQIVSSQLNKQTNLNETLNIIVSQLVAKLNYINPSIYIIDSDKKSFRVKSLNVAPIFITLAERLIGKSIYDVKFNLSDDNLLSKAITTGEINTADNLYELLTPHINKTAAKILQTALRISTVIVAPIRIDNNDIGCLVLASDKKNITNSELKVVTTFADQISIAIYNSQQSEALKLQLKQLSRKNDDLQSLFDLTTETVKYLDPDKVAQIAVDSLPNNDLLIGGIITSYNKNKKEIVVKAVSTTPLSKKAFEIVGDFHKYKLDVTDPVLLNHQVVKTILDNKPYATNNVSEVLSPPVPQAIVGTVVKLINIRSVVAFPLEAKNEPIGTISFFLKYDYDKLDYNQKKLLETYALQIGVALENALLFTESNNTQKDLEQALNQLQEARRQERDMIDIMGHELRTPITIVRNALVMIETIKKTTGQIPDDKLTEYLEMALESTRREISLIEMMLSATKADAQRFQISKEKVDMIDTIKDALEGQKRTAETKKISLIFNPSSETFIAYADRVRTQEVIDNLLSNAVKYTNEGTVEISIRHEGDFIKTSIKDSGIGIAAEDIPNLGKKFFRAQQYTNESKLNIVRPGGTGLGLYVVYSLVDQMGGKVEVQSELGKGSTFSFTLPVFTGQKEEKFTENLNHRTLKAIRK